VSFPVSQLMSIARSTADRLGVDPALFMALCEHESAGWKAYAIRYEPGFFKKYVEPQNLLSHTEATARATSWGLGQIMGQVARELGFKGEFLSELLDPETGCEFACRKLKACLARHPNEVRAALLEYNGGSNLKYPDLVLDKYSKYKI
jgi:soluble lytic murein transglycosylase-like protein